MGDEGHQSSGKTPIVFVSDVSNEAIGLAIALRAVGYDVIEVPPAFLGSRIGAQRPNVVIVDVDADGLLAEITRIRRMPGTGAIDFVYLGSGTGTIKGADDALANDGSAFFPRPVDVAALVRKLESLTGGPAPLAGDRRSSRPPSSSIPVPRASSPSLPAPGLRTPGPPLPMSTPSLVELVDPPRSLATFGTVSHELQQLLADAELRAEVHSSPDVPLPSPEEELEAVLPADVLASLDEPIEGEEDDDGPDGGGSKHETQPGLREGAHAKGTTSGGTRQPTTGSGAQRPSTGAGSTHERKASSRDSDAPVRTTNAPTTGTGSSISGQPTPRREMTDEAPRSTRSSSWAPPPPPMPGTLPPRDRPTQSVLPRASRPPPSPPEDVQYTEPRPSPSVEPSHLAGVVLTGPDTARRFFADAIARRATGALCFEGPRTFASGKEIGGTVRRVVIRDGDLVTAASGAEDESLVWFLGARGELPRDEIARLADRIPPYGRHAGAALVAHGWLRQDQLWQALRAHAEWVATIVLRLSGGTAQLEPEPPGRLRAEPSVFGAATGAEIFVDLVRRAIAPADALDRLGGADSRVGDGPNQGLLAECNLPPQDYELLSRARGGSIADLLARSPDPEIVAVVHALALLGVLDVVPAIAAARKGEGSTADREIAALDEEAIRARVRARLELVEEGDYFAVLGVTREATSYEIRRAFIELRRTFEPSRILTPRLADLADGVKDILAVLDEAYEILRDAARRERYRRAIDARPE